MQQYFYKKIHGKEKESRQMFEVLMNSLLWATDAWWALNSITILLPVLAFLFCFFFTWAVCHFRTGICQFNSLPDFLKYIWWPQQWRQMKMSFIWGQCNKEGPFLISPIGQLHSACIYLYWKFLTKWIKIPTENYARKPWILFFHQNPPPRNGKAKKYGHNGSFLRRSNVAGSFKVHSWGVTIKLLPCSSSAQ